MLAKIVNSEIGEQFNLTVIDVDFRNRLQGLFTLTKKYVVELNKPEKEAEIELTCEDLKKVVCVTMTLQHLQQYGWKPKYHQFILKEIGSTKYTNVDVVDTENGNDIKEVDSKIAEIYDTYQTRRDEIAQKIEDLELEIEELQEESEKLKAEQNDNDNIDELEHKRSQLLRKVYKSGTFNV